MVLKSEILAADANYDQLYQFDDFQNNLMDRGNTDSQSKTNLNSTCKEIHDWSLNI